MLLLLLAQFAISFLEAFGSRDAGHQLALCIIFALLYWTAFLIPSIFIGKRIPSAYDHPKVYFAMSEFFDKWIHMAIPLVLHFVLFIIIGAPCPDVSRVLYLIFLVISSLIAAVIAMIGDVYKK